MASPLEVNKQAQRLLIDRIRARGGHVEMGAYGNDIDLVGAFAPLTYVSVEGIVPGTDAMLLRIFEDVTPVQVCDDMYPDGTHRSRGREYAHWKYGKRWTYHADTNTFQHHIIGDHPDDPTKEIWIYDLVLGPPR